MEKKIIRLDLTGCKYISEVHERIRVAFDFPEWYGANWPAFWDLLRSECDADEVLIYGEHTLPKSFERDIQWMHKALDKNVEKHEEYSKLFSQIRPFAYRVVD